MSKLATIVEGLDALDPAGLLEVRSGFMANANLEEPVVPITAPAPTVITVVKTDFTVELIGFDPPANKVKVISTVRAITGKGLVESQGVVNGLVYGPVVIIADVGEEVAKEAATKLEAAGARVAIR